MLKLKARSYTNGKFFRPKPVIVERPESHLLVIATPWGALEAAQKAAESVADQFDELAREDLTTPFDRLASVSAAANRLRAGVMLANQHLFRNENGKLWKSAVEIVAIHCAKGVLSWVHVGSPHLLLNDGKNIHPFAYDIDWAGQSDNQGPLFAQALGIEANVPLNVGSLRIPEDSQVLMLSRTHVPRSVFQAKNFDFHRLEETLINDNPASPFWLGVLEFAADEDIPADPGPDPEAASDEDVA